MSLSNESEYFNWTASEWLCLLKIRIKKHLDMVINISGGKGCGITSPEPWWCTFWGSSVLPSCLLVLKSEDQTQTSTSRKQPSGEHTYPWHKARDFCGIKSCSATLAQDFTIALYAREPVGTAFKQLTVLNRVKKCGFMFSGRAPDAPPLTMLALLLVCKDLYAINCICLLHSSNNNSNRSEIVFWLIVWNEHLNLIYVGIWLFISSKAITEQWEIKEALEETRQIKFRVIVSLWMSQFSPPTAWHCWEKWQAIPSPGRRWQHNFLL